MMEFLKYQGAGNDFLIADNRDGHIVLDSGNIAALCDRRYGVGADGIMLLENCPGRDFRMVYYNSDGSGGMMCGNGGRCIAAFAADIMGLDACTLDFEAADGPHRAEVSPSMGGHRTVSLGMKNVSEMYRCPFVEDFEAWFAETGTRHLVCVSERPVCELDVEGIGRRLRWKADFAPAGVNVNFIHASDGLLNVRTFEKGVEAETYACGTGICASAIAALKAGIAPSSMSDDGLVSYEIQALRDRLRVDFRPGDGSPLFASDVVLTGPATFVAKIIANPVFFA